MYTILLTFLLLFAPQISPSSFPDHFLKSLPLSSPSHSPQQYLELTHPLPSDHLAPSCSLPIIHHSFANTINSPPLSVPYSPPSDCRPPWSYVALHFHAHCKGDQYDRISAVWLGGAELLRTSTAEPSPSGIFWNVRKDITRYSALLMKRHLNFTMMLENIVNHEFTGVYHVNVTLFFYKDNVVKVPSISPDRSLYSKVGFRSERLREDSWSLYGPPADLIVPISDSGEKGFWFRIDGESDVHSKKIRIPANTYRAVLELYVSFHGNDEFWYSNPPNSYIRMNNLTTERGNGAYREVFVTIDGKFAGSEPLFPVIFTGGINPLFWEPVVAIGAFNLPSYNLDLTPFLGLILDRKEHEFSIGVTDSISYWLVDANLHIWLDHNSSKVEAKYTDYLNPQGQVKRFSKFKQLDGSFKINAKRKSHFLGWVKSSAGNLSTAVMQHFRVNNAIQFEKNGTFKSVKQRIKAIRQVKVMSELGGLIAREIVRRYYPLNVMTATLPGTRKNRYVLATNVSHALKEKIRNGGYLKSVRNSQVSIGWMEVKDHNVLSGRADTNQSYKYCDSKFGCYSRTVAARDGRLIGDNATFARASSM